MRVNGRADDNVPGLVRAKTRRCAKQKRDCGLCSVLDWALLVIDRVGCSAEGERGTTQQPDGRCRQTHVAASVFVRVLGPTIRMPSRITIAAPSMRSWNGSPSISVPSATAITGLT